MSRKTPLVIALALALAACGGVKVVPLGAEIRPRPADCAIEFLEKAPARTYEELAELSTTINPGSGQARQALRRPACELGADAVIVTRHVVTSALGNTLVAGIAIRFGPEKPAEVPAEVPATPEKPAAGATSL